MKRPVLQFLRWCSENRIILSFRREGDQYTVEMVRNLYAKVVNIHGFGTTYESAIVDILSHINGHTIFIEKCEWATIEFPAFRTNDGRFDQAAFETFCAAQTDLVFLVSITENKENPYLVRMGFAASANGGAQWLYAYGSTIEAALELLAGVVTGRKVIHKINIVENLIVPDFYNKKVDTK